MCTQRQLHLGRRAHRESVAVVTEIRNQKSEINSRFSVFIFRMDYAMSLPVIAITNASTCLTDAQVEAAVPALQRQVSLDFRAYWDLDCQLILLPKNDALTSGWWQISVVDNPDQAGALGYHELTSHGTPLGKVFAGLDIQCGGSWTVTLSHELLEMLADPWINWCAQGSDGKVYALEVCDAVEADELGYQIDGVLVSDFITPAWFEPTQADRVDFKQRISKPLQLAAGGYISVLMPAARTQIAAQTRFRSAGKQAAAANMARRSGGTLRGDELLPAPAHAVFGDFHQQPGGG